MRIVRCRAVELDPPPARDRRERGAERAAVAQPDAREAPVVPGEAQRPADRRVDEPVAGRGGRERDLDRFEFGQVAADIRNFRPPEPYKGKGVRYAGEKIELKEAKKK